MDATTTTPKLPHQHFSVLQREETRLRRQKKSTYVFLLFLLGALVAANSIFTSVIMLYNGSVENSNANHLDEISYELKSLSHTFSLFYENQNQQTFQPQSTTKIPTISSSMSTSTDSISTSGTSTTEATIKNCTLDPQEDCNPIIQLRKYNHNIKIQCFHYCSTPKIYGARANWTLTFGDTIYINQVLLLAPSEDNKYNFRSVNQKMAYRVLQDFEMHDSIQNSWSKDEWKHEIPDCTDDADQLQKMQLFDCRKPPSPKNMN